MIAWDLRLVASRLYIKLVLPGPGHVTYSCGVTLILFYCLIKSRYWIEPTALRPLSREGSCLWFLTTSSEKIQPKSTTDLHSNTMWYDREYILCHIEEISVLWVRFLLWTLPVGYVRYPQCIANRHWVGVVITEIWITLHPVFWCSRRRIQIEPGRCQ